MFIQKGGTMKNYLMILTLLSSSSFAAAEKKTVIQTKTIMNQFLGSISTLVPLSLDKEDFGNQKNHKKIAKELNILAKFSRDLEQHFKKNRSSDYSFIAKSMARDARDARDLFAKKSFEQSRFVIQNLSENCATCHLKEPSKSREGGPSGLFSKVKRAQLNKYESARYSVISRNFDEAASQYEEILLSSPNMDQEIFENYLVVALRVSRDIPRIKKVLTKISNKKSVKFEEKEALKNWSKELDLIKNKKLLEISNLTNARALFSLATNESEKDLEETKLIFAVAASSAIHRLINQNKSNALQASELYYCLGRIEETLSKSFWISEIENYLEQSIRKAPKSSWAKKSYNLLEEQYTIAYSGSQGTAIPEDIKSLLVTLKKLSY